MAAGGAAGRDRRGDAGHRLHRRSRPGRTHRTPTLPTTPTLPVAPEPTAPAEDYDVDLEFDYHTPEQQCLPPETFGSLRRIDHERDYHILQADYAEYEQPRYNTLTCVYMRADLTDQDGEPHPPHVFITTVVWLHRDQPARFGSGTSKQVPLASGDLLDWFDNAWSAREYDDWRDTCHRHRLGSCDTIKNLPLPGPGWLLMFDGHVGNLEVTANITYAGAGDQEHAYVTMTGIYRDIVRAEVERRPHHEPP